MGIKYPININEIAQTNNPIINENSDFEQENFETTLEDTINGAVFDQDRFDTSFVSKPYFSFDMGEPLSFNLDFVYNFYVENEREAFSAANSQTYMTADFQDVLFKSRTEKTPRYVKLTIKGPEDIEYSQPSSALNQLSMQEIKEYLNSEAANSTPYYSGFELYDADIEGNVYQHANNNLFMTTTVDAGQYSASGQADLIADSVSLSTLYGGSAKELIKEMMNTKNTSNPYFLNQASSELIEIYKQNASYSNINFSIKVANLFFGDIIKKANRKNNTVFASEYNALTNISQQKTNELTSQYLDTLGSHIHEKEFDVEVGSIETILPEVFAIENSGKYTIKHVGYVIQKEQKMPNGEIQKFSKIVKLTDKKDICLIDNEILYGGLYQYTARSLYEVVAPVYDPNDYETLSYERFLIMSEGITSLINCSEFIPPKPPSAVRGRIDFKYNVPNITWQFPLNTQRDIKRFQIFKRENLNLPFVLVAEYNFDNSNNPVQVSEIAQSKNLYKMKFPKLSYTDYKYKSNSNPIYAVASVDAHGLSSKLSTQISVKYNKYSNKGDVKLISREGAPKPYPNIFIEKDTFQDCIKVSNTDRMTVFFDPDHYRLYKNILVDEKQQIYQKHPVDLLSVNPRFPTYKIHITNLDSIKSKEINIKLSDEHTENIEATESIASFNSQNLTFT